MLLFGALVLIGPFPYVLVKFTKYSVLCPRQLFFYLSINLFVSLFVHINIKKTYVSIFSHPYYDKGEREVAI